ncbi:MAG: PDZ domain-containing protein [Pyrinomonadaceae bacterium]
MRYFLRHLIGEFLALLSRLRLRRALEAIALVALVAGGAYAQRTNLPPVTRPPAGTIPLKPVVASSLPSRQPAPPPVIAVVHHISGWKLRALLTPSEAPVASVFDENFVRTNIVAGFIMSDGRSVMARLPHAEAQMLNLSTAFRDLKMTATTEDAGLLLLVRPDGMQFNARFIGFDASTGLSLLESEQPLLTPVSEADIVMPVVGQRVRVISPVRAEIPTAIPAGQTAPRPEDAPVGEEGVIYMNMGEELGKLREIKRSPSGKAMEVTIELNHVQPEWTGGVALSETGTLVGIIEESHERATRLLSAESVRGAANRVKTRRASVPQPWLGARGDAVAFAPLDLLIARGWPRDEARTLLQQQRGVLLTSVAPGTPAALAGLRPGDVVSRIGPHDVRGIEDMSSMLKELGGNMRAEFTVLRARSQPLNVSVCLSESSSPALDTARVELGAAQSEFRAKLIAVERAHEEVRRHRTEFRRIEDDLRRVYQPGQEKSGLMEQLRHEQARIHATQEQARKIELDYQLWRTLAGEAEARYRAASEAYRGLAHKPLLSLGMEAVAVSTATAKFFGSTESGLLVMSVQPGSAAAQIKIQIGDFIESINEQRFSDADWNFAFSADFNTDLSFDILRKGQKLTLKFSGQNTHR